MIDSIYKIKVQSSGTLHLTPNFNVWRRSDEYICVPVDGPKSRMLRDM